MSRSASVAARWLACGLLLAVATTPAAAADAGTRAAATAGTAPFGFGSVATPREIAGWDIDVRPDGRGLPAGHGSVREGQAIYDAQCAGCHGTFGESNSNLQIAGGVGTLGSAQPVRTTGSKLNYATTLFDYIRRAMPLTAPQTLSTNEVYALTAYVLYLNDILGDDAALDAASLVALRMPNRDGFSTAHGMMRRDGEPDTHNVQCMRDCTREVAVTSQLPAYAKDSHGDIDAQMRSFTHVAAAEAVDRGLALAQRAGCVACHAMDVRIVGPALRDVAARYAGDAGAPARLAASIRAGSQGAWGGVPMPAQRVSAAQASELVRWILDGAH